MAANIIRNNKTLQLLVVFIIILIGHYCLKALELLEFTSNGHLLISYFDITKYADKPWQLLLPVNIGDDFYRYSTTGLVLMSGVEKIWAYSLTPELSMNATFLTLSSLLIFTTFITAWKATHSRTFTITLTICMAFGTQFNGLYANSSIMILYFFYAFIEVNLLFFYLLLTSSTNSLRIKAGFAFSLVCVALCWEMWLDYAVFLYVALTVLYFATYKKKISFQYSKLNYILFSLSAVLILYLVIKVNSSGGISEHFEKGKESESVLNYLQEPDDKTYIIFVEDIVSNLITYTYISLSNYFPSFLLSSNSLHYLGQKTTEYQYGYHSESQHFVFYHNVFYWYYFAGAIFALLLMAIYKTVKSLWTSLEPGFYILLLLTFVMILFGSFAHLFIKYRPYLSVPLLGYKCIVSTLGVTLLLSVLTMRVRKNLSERKFYAVTFIIWVIVISGGFFRPARLLELGSQVMPGSAWQQMPDPLSNPASLYYFLFPGSISSARIVNLWLNQQGGNIVNKSVIQIHNDGKVFYLPDSNWQGKLSGENIIWKNLLTGENNIWSPKK